MTIKMALSFLLVFIFSFNSISRAQEGQDPSPRFVIHILDYLAKDYSGAVTDDGQVKDSFEYQEQVEFIENAVRSSDSLKEIKSNPEIHQSLLRLKSFINSKSHPSKVSSLARQIQQELIKVSGLSLHPPRWPDLNQGRRLYQTHCTSCHGIQGHGDGLAAKGLEPAPTPFAIKESMQSSSPFAAYNTIRLGVPETAMASYSQFSDQDVWALAFYVHSLRFAGEKGKWPQGWSNDAEKDLKDVASLTDGELKEKLVDPSLDPESSLVALRTFSREEKNGTHFLSVAKTKLNQSLNKYGSGDFKQASALAVEAYLEGIEPIEATLKTKDPQKIVVVEKHMAKVRSFIDERRSIDEVTAAVTATITEIDHVSDLMKNKTMSPWLSFLAAFSVLLREGFEAVLLILALLGVVRAAKAKTAHKWVHAGWILALLSGVLMWFLSGWLMQISGARREMLEGATSLFAVLVLVYVGFWLHRQTEVSRWKYFLQVKVKSILDSKKLFGLAVISFVAVFREAIETVLFLRAIWLDSGASAKTSMLSGVVTSLTLVFVLSWWALKWSKNLPIRRLFSLSSALMLALATILVGKGIHAIQESGYIGMTAFPVDLRIELLGIYPSAETWTAQSLVFIMVSAIWFFADKPSVPTV